ncbi:NAD(P)H-hydrate dehydratase [bacterium]|nr:NAD(P)H-hydrate dehydratase [bacterium]
MRSLDAATLKNTPVKVLMKRAGKAVFEALLPIIRSQSIHKVIVLCGPGNNGGDGRIVAQLLANKKIPVLVQSLNSNISFKSDKHTLVLDALFGTGLSRPLKGDAARLVRYINKCPGYKVALDIPSGLDATTGKVLGVAFKANTTITLEYPKTGFYFLKAHEYVGDLVLKKIGLINVKKTNIPIKEYLMEHSDFSDFTQKRKRDVHKGTMGHLFVVAGSPFKMGAGSMTSLAGLAAGSGLSTLVLPKKAFAKIDPKALEIMYAPVPDKNGFFGLVSLKPVLQIVKNAKMVILGLGMGTVSLSFVRSFLKSYPGPLLIDADGLNSLASCVFVLQRRKGITVLTPHPAEMARLAGKSTAYVQNNRLAVARKFAVEKGVIVLLKGFRTLIAFPDGKVFVNPTGSPAMATAGQGDVLSGLIGGILCEHGLNPLGVAAAVYYHGLAGETFNSRVALATDMIKAFQKVYYGIKRNKLF